MTEAERLESAEFFQRIAGVLRREALLPALSSRTEHQHKTANQLAKEKLEVQQGLRRRHYRQPPHEFNRNWLALCQLASPTPESLIHHQTKEFERISTWQP